MKLADKPCYPELSRSYPDRETDGTWYENNGNLTFRERLIIALASNPAMFTESPETIAENIIYQSDLIITEMEK